MEKLKIKPKIIIIEGVDRTGKTELINEINKQTSYRHIIRDRGPIGYRAYSIIFNRDAELLNGYCDLEKSLAEIDDITIVYLYCETDELIKRCIETNHEMLDFDFHKKVYLHCLGTSHFRNRLIIDSTKKNTKDIVNELIERKII